MTKLIMQLTKSNFFYIHQYVCIRNWRLMLSGRTTVSTFKIATRQDKITEISNRHMKDDISKSEGQVFLSPPPSRSVNIIAEERDIVALPNP